MSEIIVVALIVLAVCLFLKVIRRPYKPFSRVEVKRFHKPTIYEDSVGHLHIQRQDGTCDYILKTALYDGESKNKVVAVL